MEEISCQTPQKSHEIRQRQDESPAESPPVVQHLSTLQSIAEDTSEPLTLLASTPAPRTGSLVGALGSPPPSTLTSTATARALWRRPECSNCPTYVLPPLEDPVQGTTDDAAVSKLSAVTSGYYEDPYLHYFVRHPCRRSPLINRGHFTRVAAVRKVISQFLTSIPADVPVAQIVNLGAGLDTLYFWITEFWTQPTVRVFECDFLEVIVKKISVLTRRQPLWDRLGVDSTRRSAEDVVADLQRGSVGIKITDTLSFIPVDIRQFQVLDAMLKSSGFSPNYPTLFISECVLIYLQACQSDAIIEWASQAVQAPSAFVLYEQIHPHDAFGRTMVRNLGLRGCPLLGIQKYPTLKDQKQRFLERGWSKVSAADMNQVYDEFLDKFELVRIQNLELFDEVEEWRLIQAHYFTLVAVRHGSPLEASDPQPASDNNVAVETNEARQPDVSWRNTPSLTHYLNDLGGMWERDHQVLQELPRFTTEEFRTNPDAIQSLCSGHMLLSSSALKPGSLSPLMRPEAMGLVGQPPYESGPSSTRGGRDAIPPRRWSLQQESPDPPRLLSQDERCASSFSSQSPKRQSIQHRQT